jgi:hypothetical protein
MSNLSCIWDLGLMAVQPTSAAIRFLAALERRGFRGDGAWERQTSGRSPTPSSGIRAMERLHLQEVFKAEHPALASVS